MLGGRSRHRAVADYALGRRSAASVSASCCRRSTWARCAGCRIGLISQGSSTINFLRQLGGAVGISLVGIVLEWRLQAEQAQPLRAFHETFALIGVITACAVIAAWRMGAQPRLAAPAP